MKSFILLVFCIVLLLSFYEGMMKAKKWKMYVLQLIAAVGTIAALLILSASFGYDLYVGQAKSCGELQSETVYEVVGRPIESDRGCYFIAAPLDTQVPVFLWHYEKPPRIFKKSNGPDGRYHLEDAKLINAPTLKLPPDHPAPSSII